MTETMRRVLLPGTCRPAGRKRQAPVFVIVEHRTHVPPKDEEQLSIYGIVGPRADGVNILYGQVSEALLVLETYAPGWDEKKARDLRDVWETWHLNNMRPGCSHQQRMGWVYESHPTDPCPICGYKMGTAWCSEPVPPEVLDWLFNLPKASRPLPLPYARWQD